MKRFLFPIIVLCLVFPLQAKDVDLKACGAKADGKTPVTKVLQKAIDAVSAAGGGRVILSGGTFLSAPIELKSGVDLHIEADAVLLASPNIEDYPDRTDVRHFNSEAMPRFRNVSFIYADEAVNIAISGRGRIDVNGQYHIRRVTDPEARTWWMYERIYPIEKTLPRVVFFAGCKFVSITDITMQNQPAGWSYWIHDCDYVTFDRCKILADVRFPNNDGIHINCSRDVTVSNCIVEAGDDAIIVRANSRSLKENKASERVVVTNCSLKSWANGIRIGWTNDGVMRQCSFSNIVISNSWRGIAFDFPKKDPRNDFGREASLVEDMIFSNILMDNLYSCPIEASVSSDEEVLFEGVRNLYFTDIHASAINGVKMRALQDKPFKNLVFSNCTFKKVKQEDMDIPQDMLHRLKITNETPGDVFLNVEGLVLENTVFYNADGTVSQTYQ